MGKKDKSPEKSKRPSRELLAIAIKPEPLSKGIQAAIADAAREVENEITQAVRITLDYERERIADELAHIIGDWPHGLEDLEALEARCRRGEP
jgi:hypothetical protein